MKRLREENVNTREFWDKNWTNTEPWIIGKSVLVDRLEALALKIRPFDLVLDVGGGRGEIAAWMRKRSGCHVAVADIATSAVAECWRRGVPAIECDFRELSVKMGDARPWDIVYSGELLEHLDDPAELVKQMASACKPEGWLSLSTPFGDRWKDEITHMWAFDLEGVETLLKPYGEVEIATLANGFEDGPGCIVAHCKVRA